MRPSATDRFFVAPIINGAVAKGRTINLTGSALAVTEDDETETTIVTITAGSVPVDVASFGIKGDALSYIFRKFTTADAIDTLAAITLSFGEALYDLVITINGKKRLAADAFQQDFRVKRTRTANGAPTLFGTDVAGTVERSGVLATAAATIDASGNDVRVRMDPNTADDVDWTVTVQVQITRDVT